MFRPVRIGSAVLLIAMTTLFLSGCGAPAKKEMKKETTQLSLHFTPGETSTYEVGVTVTKDFKFEQPALNKLRKEETTTQVRMTIDQMIDKIDEDGWAVAKITIQGLACKMVKQNEVQIDYDSTRPDNQKNPLQKLIGQSYTIRLSPDGKAEVVDAGTVKTSGIPGLEGRLAKRIFTDEEIVKRHEILAMPDQAAALAAGSTWDRIVPSPPGLLSAKSFQKVYTLSDIKTEERGKVATITMAASESAVPAEDAAANQGGLGIFAKMLDNEDEYTGKLQMNIDTGKVLDYDETLTSSYIAQEANPNATPEQGPDTLVIRFIQRVDRKLIK